MVLFLFCVAAICRQTAAYSGGNALQAAVLYVSNNQVVLQSHPLSTSVGWVDLNTNGNGNLDSVLSAAAPPPPQLEFIETDRTGHPVDGIPGTYQPKYDEGYKVGYTTGYDSGFVTGKQRGTDEGSSNGRNDGYNKGFGETYQPAYDSAYTAQLPIGQAAGWYQGNTDGVAEGYKLRTDAHGFFGYDVHCYQTPGQ